MGIKVNAPHAVSEIIEGEAIVVNLKTGCYFSIGKVGALVWDCIMKNLDSADTAKRIAKVFDVDVKIARREIDVFTQELLKESLVIMEDSASSSPMSSVEEQSSAVQKLAYETPRLVKFEDMQDLLLLDPVHEVHEQQGWPWKKDGTA
ncbi:PqqD family protein [Candidatus Woesearchaeota archaeon]|nr:PqqD family protein [Candidatus Woesearchaeota archaeon]